MLNWASHPARSPLVGRFEVSGDKSISHRTLFFGAIAEGKTIVKGFLPGLDCLSTLKAFQNLGVEMTLIDESTVHIEGVGLYGLSAPTEALDCGNSGTTMRLLMGLLAAQPFDTVLVGDESLHQRPMQRISDPLNQMGAQIKTTQGKAPIEIKKNDALTGMHYTLPIASAQLKTALLFAGLYCTSPLRLCEREQTRDHTERMFVHFGHSLQGVVDKELTIMKGVRLKGCVMNVPGDLSSAAFFIVAATLIEGSDITIAHVGVNPTRLGLIHLLKKMGADITLHHIRIESNEVVADVHVKHAVLNGITVTQEWVAHTIDEFPIFFIAAAKARGVTQILGLNELRHKESDRIKSMVTGLNTLGIRACEEEDNVMIHGGVIHGGEVSSFGDHRIAMAFAIAGSLATEAVTVLNCQSVITSFPSFMRIAHQLQLPIEAKDV